ncbi:MAG TPA: biotin-dependent carboxyltransferase family protein [Gaiellaceae bacterium]|nr:biotin-dependent carboxyltransferase family protein [Gaiellaceae bacterium]
MTAVRVLRAGPLTTFQDLGRQGYAHLGVPPSGAVDPDALRLGNRLLGNPPGTAALEATLVGPRLRFDEAALVALTGAETRRGVNVTVSLEAGDELDVGSCLAGARAYVCVRGGFRAPAVLGSGSTDLLTGLGPPPLRDGDVLEIGSAPAEPPPSPSMPATPEAPTSPGFRLLLGPRDDRLTPDGVNALFATRWTVTSSANRVGVRLDGPPLARARDDELLSEGIVTGAVQLPPSGKPILLLTDHPTTGGYPVVGVVDERDLGRAGQLRPGDAVRFIRQA